MALTVMSLWFIGVSLKMMSVPERGGKSEYFIGIHKLTHPIRHIRPREQFRCIELYSTQRRGCRLGCGIERLFQGRQISVVSSPPAPDRSMAGPPLHSHPWDECFFVLSGEVEFSFVERTVQALPGTVFHLPAGTPHGFMIKENGTTMLEFTGQGSKSTQMFTSVDSEVAPGAPTAADVPKLIDILARYGAVVEA